MNVALCHPVFWPEVRRGAERFTWELARGLAARGHVPRIVTSHRGLPRTDVEQGIAVTRTWRPPDARLRCRLYDDFLVQAPGTYLVLRRGGGDVAQAMQAADAVAAARWARGIAVFAHMGIPHRAALANRRGRLALMLRATRECDAVTALSQHAAAAFERWLGVRAHVIHPPVDLDAFAPAGVRSPSR